MGCMWTTEWAAHLLPMGILPCKLGSPLRQYTETVGSSVGSPLLPNMKKLVAQWAVGWAAHGLPKKFCPLLPYLEPVGSPLLPIWNSGQLSWKWSRLPMGCTWEFCHANEAAQCYGNRWQLSAQPTTFKYGNDGQLRGQPTELPTIKCEIQAIFDSHARHL